MLTVDKITWHTAWHNNNNICMREIRKREPQRRQWLERGTFALALYILSYLRGLRVFWIEKFRLEFSNTGIGFLNKTSKTKFVQNCYPKSDFGWQIQPRVFGYANFVGFFSFVRKIRGIKDLQNCSREQQSLFSSWACTF